jgi:hypothetical protein
MNNSIEPNNICSSERTEQITQALAKIIAIITLFKFRFSIIYGYCRTKLFNKYARKEL